MTDGWSKAITERCPRTGYRQCREYLVSSAAARWIDDKLRNSHRAKLDKTSTGSWEVT